MGQCDGIQCDVQAGNGRRGMEGEEFFLFFHVGVVVERIACCG